MTDFADELKSIRKRLGLSQRKLASSMEVDESIINRLENSTRKPPRNQLFWDKFAGVDRVSDEDVYNLQTAAGYLATNRAYVENHAGIRTVAMGDLQASLRVYSPSLTKDELERLAEWIMVDVEHLLKARERRHQMLTDTM